MGMRPITVSKSLATGLDADGIALGQQLGAAGPLVLNGALGNGGAASAAGVAASQGPVDATPLTLEAAYTGPARVITLASSDNISAINFTIVGIDANGDPLTDTIAGPNNNTVSFTGEFASVTSITPDDTPAGAEEVSAGWATFSDPDGITLGSQRRVALASSGNLSGINFTITGEDDDGHVVTEVLAGPNNNSVYTVLDYALVTSIEASAAVGTNVTAGTNGFGSSDAIPMNWRMTPFEIGVQCDIDGTIDFDIQYTLSDIRDGNPAGWLWTTPTAFDGKTADTVDKFTTPCTAMRILINSGTGSINLRLVSAGN